MNTMIDDFDHLTLPSLFLAEFLCKELAPGQGSGRCIAIEIGQVGEELKMLIEPRRARAIFRAQRRTLSDSPRTRTRGGLVAKARENPENTVSRGETTDHPGEVSMALQPRRH